MHRPRTVVVAITAMLLGLGARIVLAQSRTLAPAGSNVEWELDPTSAKIDTHLGRAAIFLRGQTPPAFAAYLEFSDGTIEFDIAPMPAANFVGLVFRYASGTQHENVYLRLRR